MAIARDIELTGNAEIDQFFHKGGTRLLPVEGNTYYWGFSNYATGPKDTFESVNNESAKNMVRGVLEQFTHVVNISFKEIDYSVGNASNMGGFNVVSGKIDGGTGGASAHDNAASFFVRNLNDYSDSDYHKGNNMTVAHEVLHLLGFVDIGYKPGYTEVDTVMSYNKMVNDAYGEKVRIYEYDKNGQPIIVAGKVIYAINETLGIYDIQALQSIYGANHSYNAGDTVYKYTPDTLKSFQTIWDGGGIDTIDVSEFVLGVELNLNGGTRSNLFTKDFSLSGTEFDGTRAIGIAYGANIENAFGGKGNDIIHGNELDNVISGNEGNDTLYGGAGNDTLNGGDGDDILYGDEGDDILSGGAGTNILYGGTGNDTLISHGKDTLYGGEGNDWYQIYSTENVRIVENRDGGTDRVSIYTKDITNYVAAENIEDINLATNLTYNSSITGNDQDNKILGNNGDNILIGKKGNDVLQGYKGSDTYIFSKGDGQDVIAESSNNKVPVTDKDVLLFTDISSSQLWFTKTSYKGLESLKIKVLGTTDEISVDTWYSDNSKLEQIKTQDGVVLSIAQVEALVDIMATQSMPSGSSTGVINNYLIQTGANSNQDSSTIYGDAQNNVINGGADNDTIYGGAGNDTISGGEGTNILIGGAGNDKLISRGNDTLYGGDGSDTYEIWGTQFRIIEQHNSNDIDTMNIYTQSVTHFTASNNIENIALRATDIHNSSLTGNDLDNYVGGNFGDNVLTGGKGNDTLVGYKGSDTYIFNKGDGQDSIWEYNNNNVPLTDKDVLIFTDISAEQLWFTKDVVFNRESLLIKVLGTNDQILVNNWYSDNDKLEQIKTQDGVTLSINQVESLADIMSTQTMPTGSHSTIIDDYLAQASIMAA
ncbi:calcium-binding protein [Limnobaculum parvum]|uniref:Haemolysin-type calcium binding-related domain-containing protein n=1 Tax=Limnobaculum parvum TaxID=2172103 RepID=A0A2Y9U016_9GAMM|nr:calcium-binding protein [Limnobaculum parvum]AWH89317.1 hypothetical protein HYN51_12625 [Limnobaculum parvum]